VVFFTGASAYPGLARTGVTLPPPLPVHAPVSSSNQTPPPAAMFGAGQAPPRLFMGSRAPGFSTPATPPMMAGSFAPASAPPVPPPTLAMPSPAASPAALPDRRRRVSSTPAWLLPACVGSQVAMVGLVGLCLVNQVKQEDINRQVLDKITTLHKNIENQPGIQDYFNTAHQVIAGTVDAGNDHLRPLADAIAYAKKKISIGETSKSIRSAVDTFHPETGGMKPVYEAMGRFMGEPGTRMTPQEAADLIDKGGKVLKTTKTCGRLLKWATVPLWGTVALVGKGVNRLRGMETP
jgi:hypothetical protein